jgi:uncharacterized protein (PEP-CTERM system associated)
MATKRSRHDVLPGEAMNDQPCRKPFILSVKHRAVGWPLIGALASSGVAVQAQQLPASSPGVGAVAAAESSAASGAGTAGRSLTIDPRLSLTETYTDNVRLSNANKQSDFVTEVSPGIRVSSRGARLRGYLDYSLRSFYYANDSAQGSGSSRIQNRLNAAGTFEAIEDRAFLDVSATVGQQPISAFGTQSFDNGNVNANRTEVANYRISPYLRGRMGGIGTYEARYDWTTVRSDAAQASNLTTGNSILRLISDRSGRSLAWTLDASRQETSYRLGRDIEADRINGRLIYPLNTQLDVSLLAGWESNNYVTLVKESHATGGIGMNWRPSPTTRLSVDVERRFFGQAHTVIFDHRTPLTGWTFRDIKQATVSATGLGTGSLGSLYDLLYDQFATAQPDPSLRAQAVDNFLRANGLDPNSRVNTGFLASGALVQRNQSLSFVLRGVRNVLTLSATRIESERLNTVVTGNDDLSRAGAVRQQGLVASLSHRLTPITTVNFTASRQLTDSIGGFPGSNLRLLNANVSTRLGVRTYGTLGVRHVVFSGSTPYTENAVFGTVRIQF